MEDTIIFLTQKVFIYVSPFHLIRKKCASHFLRETENNRLKEQKHWYLTHTWSDKAFKSTFVNQSFHGGSLENTRAYSPFKRIVNSQCKMTINLRKIHNCIFTYSFKNFGHILAIQCICRFPEKRDIFLIKPRGSSLGFPANENFREKCKHFCFYFANFFAKFRILISRDKWKF